jgi:hypothetical protein
VPAIQPVRLKRQAAALAERFADPPAFVRGLHNLLEFYAERIRHSGQAGTPAPLTTAYKVHPPVLRQILQAILPRAVAQPQAGLELCDALWEQPYLEFRLLASMLLGQIVPDDPKPVLGRVQAWIQPDLEDFLIRSLLTHGLVQLRQLYPQTLIQLVQEWLDRSNTFYLQLGLRALQPMVEDPTFENLPAFFRLIHPLVRSAPGLIRPDLLDVLVCLAHRSPTETAFFLRQTLTLPNAPDTPWIIRQVLNEFPPEIEKNLRSTVRGL